MQKKFFLSLAIILISGISGSTGAMKQKYSLIAFRKKTPEIDVQVAKTLLQVTAFYIGTFLHNRFASQLPSYCSVILFDAIKNNQTYLFIQLYRNYCENFGGKEPAHRNRSGQTLLEYAIAKNNRRIVAEILESWFTYIYLFDNRCDNKKNNIFHRILSMTTEANEMLIVKSITKLIQCPANQHTLLTTKNSSETTPLDIAFKKRLNTLLVKLIHACAKQYGPKKNEQLDFVIKRLKEAQKYCIWELCAKLMQKYPQIIKSPLVYEYRDKDTFYRELIYRGIDPNTLRPPHRKTDRILAKYKQEYRPGITSTLHYFWSNLAMFSIKHPHQDITVTFGKI